MLTLVRFKIWISFSAKCVNVNYLFQCVLSRVNQWPFNAFTLDNVTGGKYWHSDRVTHSGLLGSRLLLFVCCVPGRSLPVLCVHLFHWYGLLEHFNLDVVRCWKLFSKYCVSRDNKLIDDLVRTKSQTVMAVCEDKTRLWMITEELSVINITKAIVF